MTNDKFSYNPAVKITFILLSIFLISAACDPYGQRREQNELWLNNQKEFLAVNKEFKSKFESRITDIFENYALYGDFQLAIVNEKGLAYSFAMNRNILKNAPTTLDNNSPIYIASHTKSFTGTLLKMLEEEGKINLNKSIYDYLPELTYDGSIDTKKITIRQLLNHTHGTLSTRFTWKTAFLGYTGGNHELINDLNSDCKYDASHQFRYSNTGPIIAAMIVEKVTGNSWKDEMKTRIFEPLKMNSTSCYISDYDSNDIRPAVEVSPEGKIFQTGFYKQDITMHASGGIISTINDLTIWLQANINRDLSLLKTEKSWDELHQPTTAQERSFFTYNRFGYSLGWDIAEYLGDTVLTRFGGYAGISFHISFMPSKKIGIISFSSDSRASSLTHLAANYSYNLINQLAEADNIYKDEKELFDQSFERNSNHPLPAKDDKLKLDSENHFLIGHYKNDSGWPDVFISKIDSAYIMKWGVLEGPVYEIPDTVQPYLGALGSLQRGFNIKNDSLFTGSLIYTRQD